MTDTTVAAPPGWPPNRVNLWAGPFIDRLDQPEFDKFIDWLGSTITGWWPSQVTHLELVDEGRYAYYTCAGYPHEWLDRHLSDGLAHRGWPPLPARPRRVLHFPADHPNETAPVLRRHHANGFLPRPVLEHISDQIRSAHTRIVNEH